MKYKVIACDIDDTLAVRHQFLSPRSKEIINELRAQGVLFGLASGRPLFQIRMTLDEWGFDDLDFLIGLNGAQLYDGTTKESIKFSGMKKEWVKECFEIMKPFKYTMYTYEDPDITLGLYEAPYKGRTMPLKVRMAENEEEIYSEDRDKILFRVSEEDMVKVEERVKLFPSEYYSPVKTQKTLMEFCPKGATKAYALDQFCKNHGFTSEDVAAFGDMDNDIDMIEYAGLGVCLLNGSENCKKAADVITEKTIEDDGWAYFMDHNILK